MFLELEWIVLSWRYSIKHRHELTVFIAIFKNIYLEISGTDYARKCPVDGGPLDVENTFIQKNSYVVLFSFGLLLNGVKARLNGFNI